MSGIAPYPTLGSASTAIVALPLIWQSHAEREWRNSVTPDNPIEWRPGQGIDLKRTIAIDGKAIAGELGSDSAPRLRCSLQWRCRQTQGVAASAVIEPEGAVVGFDLAGTAPGDSIADFVHVRTRVELDEPLVGIAPAGSVIWDDEILIPLTGETPALTIYTAPLSELRMPGGSWVLVRLPHATEDHPSGIEVILDANPRFDIEGLLGGEGPGSEIAIEFVLLTISDALIVWALQRADELDSLVVESDDTETMGTTVMGELYRVFGDRTPSEIRELQLGDPVLYAAHLQARRFGARGILETAFRISGGMR